MTHTNSPKSTPAMLLAPPSHNHKIKVPPLSSSSHGLHSQRGMATVSGSSSTVPSSSSSSLIIDNQGQAHDPGYLDALRQLHAQIGDSATSSKTFGGRRRLSPGSATGIRRPTRPSTLGLGLDSNMAAWEAGSSSSDEDDDDDDQQDLDPYTSLFEEAARHDALVNRSLRSPAVLSSASVSPTSTPTSAFAPIPSPNATFSGGAPVRSGTPRHTSFSTNADLDLTPKSRQPHWSARRLSSPHHHPSSSSSRPGVPHMINSTNDGWGFTGIVDVERERTNNALRNGGDVSSGSMMVSSSKLTASLLDDCPYSPASAPDSPKLVAAASQNRNKASQSTLTLNSGSGESPSAGSSSKLRQASMSQGRSKSLLKKNSSHELRSAPFSTPPLASLDGVGQTTIDDANAVTRRKSSLSHVHPPSTSTAQSPMARSPSLRRKFGVSSRKGSSRSRPSSSGAASTHTVGDAERPRDFYTTVGNADGGDTTLSTILSGKQMLGGAGSEYNSFSAAPSMAFSGSARSSSAHDSSSRRSFGSMARDEHGANEESADKMAHLAILDDDSADVAPNASKFKDGLDNFKRRGSDAVDVGAHSYELRRKMELLAMGLRFNAFKAKKKIERGFKHHEA